MRFVISILLVILFSHGCFENASARSRFDDMAGIKGPFAGDITYLAIHHTEVRALTNGRQLDSVNNFHRGRFNNISFLGKYGGYNIFIDVDGTVTWFRVYGEKTAAQLAHNFDTLSICMAGNFNIDMPKPPQIKALINLLYKYPQLTVVFHRDLADRTCPGTNLGKSWLKKTLHKYGPKDASPLKIHMGAPNLIVDDYTLMAREHKQDRDKYAEITDDRSEIGRFERNKLEKIVKRLDQRLYKFKKTKRRTRN